VFTELKNITISIVSHGHGQMIINLLEQLAQFNEHIAKVVITYNIFDEKSSHLRNYPFDLSVIQNEASKGFGANHNQAFKVCSTEYFCVMNPDIHLIKEPFESLLSCNMHPAVAVVAPLIVNPEGGIEDNARYFPTPWNLIRKSFGLYSGVYTNREDQTIEYPDWLAGMFLLIQSEKFSELSGFDESFYLYYEDVDFCARAWRIGAGVALCKEITVIHDARRESHKNFKFFKWHLSSVLRFWRKHLGRFPTHF
jgi:GT2 family glycosyltransferase